MDQDALFDEPVAAVTADMPLAARMRPQTLDEFVGQEHLTGSDAACRKLIESDRLGSVILWGPPGVGKTTLAEVIAQTTSAHFSRLSATSAGVADLRKAVEEARIRKQRKGQRTILFIDEIHRFNKAQQDAILPVVEDGTVSLVGATTENPSFEVNSALLSRSRVYILNSLGDDAIGLVVDRARLDPDRGLGGRWALEEDALQAIKTLANGDARTALTILELASSIVEPGGSISAAAVWDAAQRRTPIYDKGGEMHFDLISALHKSVRGSDPDGALYWLARMLAGGEDPLYLARRLVRMAIEDVGLADPNALPIAVAAQQAMHFIGSPEGDLALAECAVYLAVAPKSDRVYAAFKRAGDDVSESRHDPVPLHLRNAPTTLMKSIGYGEGYRHAHDYEEEFTPQQHLPDALRDRIYYEPRDRGFETGISERLRRWRDIASANRELKKPD